VQLSAVRAKRSSGSALSPGDSASSALRKRWHKLLGPAGPVSTLPRRDSQVGLHAGTVPGRCPDRWLRVKLHTRHRCKSVPRQAALGGSTQELYAKDKTQGHTATSAFRLLFVVMKSPKYPQILISPLQVYTKHSPRSILGSRGGVGEPQPLCPAVPAGWARGCERPSVQRALVLHQF